MERKQQALEYLNTAYHRLKTINIDYNVNDIIKELEKVFKKERFQPFNIKEEEKSFCIQCAWKSLLRYLVLDVKLINEQKVENWIQRLYKLGNNK